MIAWLALGAALLALGLQVMLGALLAILWLRLRPAVETYMSMLGIGVDASKMVDEDFRTIDERLH